mgnify:CR=1 FL=1
MRFLIFLKDLIITIYQIIFDSKGAGKKYDSTDAGPKTGLPFLNKENKPPSNEPLTYYGNSGSWTENKPEHKIPQNGFGTFTFKHIGEIGTYTYTGMWKDGLKHGKGVEINASGNIINEGVWERGIYTYDKNGNEINYDEIQEETTSKPKPDSLKEIIKEPHNQLNLDKKKNPKQKQDQKLTDEQFKERIKKREESEKLPVPELSEEQKNKIESTAKNLKESGRLRELYNTFIADINNINEKEIQKKFNLPDVVDFPFWYTKISNRRVIENEENDSKIYTSKELENIFARDIIHHFQEYITRLESPEGDQYSDFRIWNEVEKIDFIKFRIIGYSRVHEKLLDLRADMKMLLLTNIIDTKLFDLKIEEKHWEFLRLMGEIPMPDATKQKFIKKCIEYGYVEVLGGASQIAELDIALAKGATYASIKYLMYKASPDATWENKEEWKEVSNQIFELYPQFNRFIDWDNPNSTRKSVEFIKNLKEKLL